MSLQFVRARPVQAGKLTAIVVTLLFAVGAVYGIIPDEGLRGLFAVVSLGIVLALVVTVETLLASIRFVGSESSLTDHFADGRLYTAVRAIEVLSVVLSAGGLVVLVATLPDEAPAGPGAIGLLFLLAGLGLVVLGGSLVRTLTEYYYYRHHGAA